MTTALDLAILGQVFTIAGDSVSIHHHRRPKAVDEHAKLAYEGAFAVPPIGAKGEVSKMLIGAQLPDGKVNQEIAIQAKEDKVRQVLERRCLDSNLQNKRCNIS